MKLPNRTIPVFNATLSITAEEELAYEKKGLKVSGPVVEFALLNSDSPTESFPTGATEEEVRSACIEALDEYVEYVKTTMSAVAKTGFFNEH